MTALHHDPLTLAQAARIMREAVKDKSYQLYPMGQEAAAYLRVKRKRLTDSSYRDYERGLDKLARYFPDLGLWEGRSLAYVAGQAGHSIATLAKHYAGVIAELEDSPRVPAAEAIRQARENTTRRATG